MLASAHCLRADWWQMRAHEDAHRLQAAGSVGGGGGGGGATGAFRSGSVAARSVNRFRYNNVSGVAALWSEAFLFCLID